MFFCTDFYSSGFTANSSNVPLVLPNLHKTPYHTKQNYIYFFWKKLNKTFLHANKHEVWDHTSHSKYLGHTSSNLFAIL